MLKTHIKGSERPWIRILDVFSTQPSLQNGLEVLLMPLTDLLGSIEHQRGGWAWVVFHLVGERKVSRESGHGWLEPRGARHIH